MDTEAKRLQLLKEVVPKAFRVGVLCNPANPFSALALQQAQVAAEQLRINAQPAAEPGRAGFLARGVEAAARPVVNAFRDELRALGYT